MSEPMVVTRFKSDMPSRLERAKSAKAAKEANWLAVCRAVNVRDGHACRACGKSISLHAVTLLEKGHHHHIQYRSACGADSTENTCLLCADCHHAEHVKRTLHVEGNADVALTFYKRDEHDQLYIWRQEVGVRQFQKD